MPPILKREYLGSPDNPKTAAVVCYFTIIGWLIGYFALYKNNKTTLAAYHLRQTLLLYILMFLVYISSFRASWGFTAFMYIVWFALWLWGFFGAVYERERPIPVIGKLSQNLFKNL